MVAAGGDPANPLQWTRDAPTLLLQPGTYDVYWVQDFDTRDHPMLLAGGVTVGPSGLVTVHADSGVRLTVADWVPARDADYGWWGAVPAGGSPDEPVNWTRAADALLLPPGAYDVYWVQDFDARDRPMLLARLVNVPSPEMGVIGVELTLAGDRLVIVNVFPGSPAERGGLLAGDVVLAVDGQSVRGLTLGEAIGNMRGRPGTSVGLTIQRDAAAQPIAFSLIRIGFNPVQVVRADAGIQVVVAPDVPALDPNNGWWGATPDGGGPGARINWAEGTTAAPLLLPPGRYDVYWRPSGSVAPQQKAAGVEVAAGQLVNLPIGTQSIPPSLVVEFIMRAADAPDAGPAFPEGIRQILAQYAWSNAPIGQQLGVRWYKDGTLILDQGEPVALANGRTEWILRMQTDIPLPAGRYRVELIESGRPPRPIEFTIGAP